MSKLTTQISGQLFIRTEGDIVAARRTIREAAVEIGFDLTDVTRIVTASSELARNIFKYAGEGVVRWRALAVNDRTGLEVEFQDQGPGIADVALALQEGYSTGGGLGMGLPGSRRLMDDLEIQSAKGQGTTITVKKWRRK